MPTPAQILEANRTIANEAIWLAALWHGALLVALLAYVRGWRPSRAEAGQLLALPLVSVGVLGLAHGSPFNGVVFIGLAISLTLIARRMRGTTTRGSDWQVIAGHAFIGIGIVYPHFLDSAVAYVVAAPFGLLPCPTLLVLAGFTILAGGFSKAWNLTLVFFGVFYGTIGVVQLGIWLDVALVAGALTLSWIALDTRRGEPQSLHPAAA